MSVGSGAAANLFVRVGADVSGFTAGMAKVQATTASTASRIRSHASAIGMGMTKYATVPIIAGLALAVRAAANFESSLNTMQAVSGATASQMKDVSARAKALGADITLPGTSAKDAADAMVQLAKGGMTAKQAMDAARGTLLLSAAAGIDNAAAATIQADALNSFALKASQAGRVSDLLAAASNASTAEITDMALSLSQASAVAHQAGYSIEDTVTALSLLANAGIKGSDAGTSLKTMLLRLQAPMGRGATAIADYGLKLRDSSGAMKKLPALANEFTNKLGGLTKAQKDAAMAAIFGTDAIRAGNILLTHGSTAFDRMRTKVSEHGAAAQLAAAKMKGFNGAMEAFKSAAETAAISIGTVLLPMLTKIMNGLSSLVGKFEELSPTLKRAVVVFALVVAAVGPALLILSRMGGAIGAIKLAMGGLSLGPWVIIAAGVAALAMSSDGARSALGSLFGVISGAVGTIAGFAQSVLSSRAAIVILQSALIAAAATFTVFKMAAVGAAIATKGVAVAQGVGAFVKLAGGVRSASGAVSLLGATFPALAGSMALPLLGVAAVAAGVFILSSRMFTGATAVTVLTGAMSGLAAGANAVGIAVKNQAAAVQGMKDANIAAAMASNNVTLAEENLNTVRRSGTATAAQLRAAELQVTQAKNDSNKATREAGIANAAATRTSQAAIAAVLQQDAKTRGLVSTVQGMRGVMTALGPVLNGGTGNTNRLTAAIAAGTQAGGANAAQMKKIGDAAQVAANGIKGTTPAADAARAALQKIADMTPADMKLWLSGIKTGGTKAHGLIDIMAAKIKTKAGSVGNATADFGPFVASINSGMQAAWDTANGWASRIRDAIKSASAGARNSPSANDIMRADFSISNSIVRDGMAQMERNAHAGANAVRNRLKIKASHLVGSIKAAIHEARSNLSSLGGSLANLAGDAFARTATGGAAGKTLQGLQDAEDARQKVLADGARSTEKTSADAAVAAAQAALNAYAAVDGGPTYDEVNQKLIDATARQTAAVEAITAEARATEIRDLQRTISDKQTAYQTDIDNLTAEFNRGGMSAQTFKDRLGTILGPGVGETLGTNFADAFSGALDGLIAQMNAIMTNPVMAQITGGTAAGITSPTKAAREAWNAAVANVKGSLQSQFQRAHPKATPGSTAEKAFVSSHLDAWKAANKSKYGMSKGGIVPGFGTRDTVPAMLTPGEGVISRKAMANLSRRSTRESRSTVAVPAPNNITMNVYPTGAAADNPRALLDVASWQLRNLRLAS